MFDIIIIFAEIIAIKILYIVNSIFYVVSFFLGMTGFSRKIVYILGFILIFGLIIVKIYNFDYSEKYVSYYYQIYFDVKDIFLYSIKTIIFILISHWIGVQITAKIP